MMSKIQDIIKDLKTLEYDEVKFKELTKNDINKVILRSPKEISSIRKASCFEASMYMAYKAREIDLEPRLFLMIYHKGYKIHYHTYTYIRDEEWVLIDWPNNITETLRDESLESIINKTLDIDYSEESWEFIEVHEINVEKVVKDPISFKVLYMNPYRTYNTTRKNNHIAISKIDKVLDSIQKVDYDFDTLNKLTKAKNIEDRKKVRLRPVKDIIRNNLGICYDSRIYLAYLASQQGLDWRYFYYERYDNRKQRFRAHGLTIIEDGGRWHLFISDDFEAAKGKVWAPVYPLKEIKDPEWWVWDIKRVGVLENFEGYILYFKEVPKSAIEGLFGVDKLTYGDYINITGSRRDLVKDKKIAKIEVKMYDISVIHYKDGSKITLK